MGGAYTGLDYVAAGCFYVGEPDEYRLCAPLAIMVSYNKFKI